MMQIVKCWDIQSWDGGDRHYHKFYVKSKEEAEKWKKIYTFDSVDEKTLEIYSSIEEYFETESEITKERALAKLTPIERKALGW